MLLPAFAPLPKYVQLSGPFELLGPVFYLAASLLCIVLLITIWIASVVWQVRSRFNQVERTMIGACVLLYVVLLMVNQPLSRWF